MKKKIILSLALLFVIFGFGALVSAWNIKINESLFEYLYKLQQIQNIRHDLVQSVVKVQSSLYSVNTPIEQDLDQIVNNFDVLESSSDKCFSCHHELKIERGLNNIRTLVEEFKVRLSYYITASANKERIEDLKRDAALVGNELLQESEQVSLASTAKIERLIQEGFARLKKARIFLVLVLFFCGILGAFVAVNLLRSITRPIGDMLGATRKIAAGELGYAISHSYAGEFGELADNFNSMSASLQGGYATLQKEIREREQTEAALRESEERYALAAQGANDGLWDWDLRADAIYFSDRWKSMLGLDDMENRLSAWFDRVHPQDRGRLEAKIAAHIEGDSLHLEDEHRVLHADGSYRWMLTRGAAVRAPSGEAYRMAGSQTDVTERKMTEEQLVHDAFHDALTDLPNRALFMNRLKHVIALARRRTDYRFAVLFLDLDRFKLLNDSLGHLAGDQILISIGKRLSSFVRPSDTVARLGGDEFAILLEDIAGEEAAIQVAARIIKELPTPFEVAGHDVFTTVSIGIAFGHGNFRPEEILRNADLAMYQAKAKGKDRFELFDLSMHETTLQRLQLETDLRRALERSEFRMEYQPVFSIAQDKIVGFEALLRWDHPCRGTIPPAEFIPMAEETGLISSIGHWVLRDVVLQAGRWQRRFPESLVFTLSINLSSKEFTPFLIQQLKEIFAEVDLDPSVLRIEITERTIMENPQAAAALLLELKSMGIGLQIDDFGTGYSSLSYLHQFPIDALKIDRSFISMVDRDREKYEIVKAIVTLAHSLNMSVVAEGVERVEELKVVSELKCQYAQGFLIAKPFDASRVDEVFRGDLPGASPLSKGGVA